MPDIKFDDGEGITTVVITERSNLAYSTDTGCWMFREETYGPGTHYIPEDKVYEVTLQDDDPDAEDGESSSGVELL